MKIVVCVKQVFDTSQLKFDEGTGEMKPGAEQILNPYCEYAVEIALRLKESQPEGAVEIIALTIGQGKEALKRAVAMGADSAQMVLDGALEGADATATAIALAGAIETLVPDYSLILTGQTAAEAASGATGLQLAALLDVPAVSQVKNVTLSGEILDISRETESGIEKYQSSLPCVLAMQKCDYEPRMPNIKGVMKANRTEIPEVSLSAIGVDPSLVGQAGAATQVAKTYARAKRETGQKLEGLGADDAAKAIVEFLQSRQLV